jgi:L-lactate dehydrogenase complex protein LldG
MSDARDDVFATIRRSLGVTGSEPTRRDIVSERLRRAPSGVIPERGQRASPERLAVFRIQAEVALATVTEVDAPMDAPGAVADYLRNHNLPAEVRLGGDLRLKAMPWADTTIEVSEGRSDGGDPTAVSHAFGGVAETGTLVMVSGPENPSTLNFLPDNHIVIVSAKDVTGDYEEMWGRLRSAYGKGQMPRTVNMITGPSRSADIEQTLILGAHGPRRLHIVLVKG